MYNKTSIESIYKDPAKKEIYLNVLNHIFDNALPDQMIDGSTVSAH